MTSPQHEPPGPARPGSGAGTLSEEAVLERLRALSTEHAVTMDPGVRATTRARLVAMAAVRSPGPERVGALRRLLAGRPAGPWRTRLTAGLAGAALTVTALGGLLGAASGARPGDLLYEVKRGGEQTRLALAGDARGTTLLGFASTRLDELGELVGVAVDADAVVGGTPSGGGAVLAAGPDLDLVLDTLSTMDAQTTEGTAALTARAVRDDDAGALSVLTGWAADQRAGLQDVSGALPAGAAQALTAATTLVDRVATRGADLQGALDCAAGPAVEGADDLGPLPAACTAAPEAPAGSATPSAPEQGSPSPGGVPAPGFGSPSAPTAVPGASGTADPTTTGERPTTATARPPSATPLPSAAPPGTTAPAPPQLPLPSLPSVPSVPGPTASVPAVPTTAGPLLPLPPVPPLPCEPPLITLGC